MSERWISFASVISPYTRGWLLLVKDQHCDIHANFRNVWLHGSSTQSCLGQISCNVGVLQTCAWWSNQVTMRLFLFDLYAPIKSKSEFKHVFMCLSFKMTCTFVLTSSCDYFLPFILNKWAHRALEAYVLLQWRILEEIMMLYMLLPRSPSGAVQRLVHPLIQQNCTVQSEKRLSKLTPELFCPSSVLCVIRQTVVS